MSGLVTAGAVAVAGGLGAAARHLCDLAATHRWGRGQVRGILAVNVVGCLFIGLLAGAVDDHAWARVAVVGLLGGFTTFSTSVLQSVELLAGGGVEGAAAPGRALLHLLGTAGLGVAAAALGVAASPF
ncbi:fluoride efflux transporter FluC [Nocardioides daphniae]|uniref:Fluoride-specific ion channel FluC n=1 Tax=Nocardioides daphniae TaxID=402297 RepID=A0A4P7UBT6_9ACTN|nr:CrcB family protein [Nocardioides daphniae]QCC77633.1 CrcB family protein [Nocardioides daphniae]GGD29937.1 hypothetical protein GCM10007231_31810 [Nocardioides daphniae]